MDNNDFTNQNAPAPAAPISETPAPENPKPKSKYTKVILICTMIAACLIACLVLILSNVTITKPTEPANNNQPVATDSPDPEPTDPDPEPDPEPDPVVGTPESTDYAKLEKTIIPARSDNGRIPDHVRGKTDSTVVVIEYADLQCPGCASMMPRMTAVYQQYQSRVAFVFRHYPISGHQKAMPAAIAAEAAGQQGYFWEMTEALYSKRDSWVNAPDSSLNSIFLSIFKSVASSGNAEKFTKDLNNANLKTKIQFDAMLGKEYAKIPGTPTVYVNGTMIDDFTTFDSFINTLKAKIDAELKK